MKYWELIADNLSKAGWSWGCVSAVDYNGRTIWIADAHRDNGKCFIVHADEKLTAFLELEAAIRLEIRRTSKKAAQNCEHEYVLGKTTMILSPRTGRPLANDVELESFMVKRELDE